MNQATPSEVVCGGQGSVSHLAYPYCPLVVWMEQDSPLGLRPGDLISYWISSFPSCWDRG